MELWDIITYLFMSVPIIMVPSFGKSPSSKQQQQHITTLNPFQNFAATMMLAALLGKDAFSQLGAMFFPTDMANVLFQGENVTELPPRYPPPLKEGQKPTQIPGTAVSGGKGGGGGKTGGGREAPAPILRPVYEAMQASSGAPTMSPTVMSGEPGGLNFSDALGNFYDLIAGTVPTAQSLTDFIESKRTPVVFPNWMEYEDKDVAGDPRQFGRSEMVEEARTGEQNDIFDVRREAERKFLADLLSGRLFA